MATPTDCLPWWHDVFQPMVSTLSVNVPSGCSVAFDPTTGDIPCPPEQMRATAEAFLRAHYPQYLAGFLGGRLTLDTYTFARYMESEVGSGTIEERVAVGEAGLHRGQRIGRSISQLLMPRGFYGPIHAPDWRCAQLINPRTGAPYNCSNSAGTCCNPYGRWAASTRSPTVLTILLAHLIVTGQSDNFSNDADDQDGPEAWIKQGQAALTNYVKGLAANGKFWVGPLPGIDHWRTFLQFTPNLIVRATKGPALLQRGIAALMLPRRPPLVGLPVCPKGASTTESMTGAEIALVALGSLAGLYGAIRFNRWLGHGEIV
jgi:hypothetical protein